MAMHHGKRRILNKQTALGALLEQAENAQGQCAGISKPVMRASAHPQLESAAKLVLYTQKIGSNALNLSSGTFLTLNSH